MKTLNRKWKSRNWVEQNPSTYYLLNSNKNKQDDWLFSLNNTQIDQRSFSFDKAENIQENLNIKNISKTRSKGNIITNNKAAWDLLGSMNYQSDSCFKLTNWGTFKRPQFSLQTQTSISGTKIFQVYSQHSDLSIDKSERCLLQTPWPGRLSRNRSFIMNKLGTASSHCDSSSQIVNNNSVQGKIL